MQCTLVRNSTRTSRAVYSGPQQNSSRVLIWSAQPLLDRFEYFSRGNKCCVMCADPVAQTRDSQQKFGNVRLTLPDDSGKLHSVADGKNPGLATLHRRRRYVNRSLGLNVTRSKCRSLDLNASRRKRRSLPGLKVTRKQCRSLGLIVTRRTQRG